MKKYAIPTADAEIVTNRAEAERALKSFGLPVVFKADGLAAGKGVVIAQEPAEAEQALKLFFEDRVFGSAGDRVLVERFIEGDEVSFMVLCDGERALPLATVKDYKKIYDGDRGPNTGGMGSHSPSVLLDASTASDILAFVVQPTLKGMKDEGRPFRGRPLRRRHSREGPQPVRPRVQRALRRPRDAVGPAPDGRRTPAVPPRLGPREVRGGRHAHVAARGDGLPRPDGRGLPGPVREGQPDHRASRMPSPTRACSSSTAAPRRPPDGQLVTAGGRVLNVCARARGLSQALKKAREASEKIHFDGRHFRRDIGKKAMEILMERSGSLLR